MNLETASQAQFGGMFYITTALDSAGRLYGWNDNNITHVQIYNNPETWTGVVTATHDKQINGVMTRGYGMAVVPYK